MLILICENTIKKYIFYILEINVPHVVILKPLGIVIQNDRMLHKYTNIYV